MGTFTERLKRPAEAEPHQPEAPKPGAMPRKHRHHARARSLIGLLALLAGACDDETTVWTDEPGILACEKVLDLCADLCVPSVEAGDDVCGNLLYDDCADAVRGVDGLVERVEGLHGRLTDDVVMGRKASCYDSMRFLPAWREGEPRYAE